MLPLTFKEHRIIHHLRWKMNFILGNLKAYRMMLGASNKNKTMTFWLGKEGGLKTKENNSGIFNPDLQHLRKEWSKIGIKP